MPENTKVMRTVEEIETDITKNKRQYEECRKYFGAMWDCDVQARLYRSGANTQLRKLRTELSEALRSE